MADERSDFIRDLIEDDLRTGKHGGRVLTRFPPEPNGYLHIGHAKSICLNFGIAQQFKTRCNLRFDDTNPVKEDVEYVDSIQRDIEWLGFSFGGTALYASDYFEEMYALAVGLITDGKAYVCELTDEQIKEYRGTLSAPGRPSPWRDRPIAESLARFAEMRAGGLADGACVLRAKIDMASANMKMRDPLLYRIRHDHHHRTGDAWCIYPMYDYAHPLSDAIEGITHSICTLEFENNRELYDWVVAHTGVSERHGFSRPQQIEFARLNLDYTVMSKRKLLTLVKDGHVAGWDDPRMWTIAGLRRRGYSAEAIRALATLVGVAKTNSVVDFGKLEFCVRDDLNHTAPRVMGVLRPLKLVVTSYDAATTETFDAPLFPPDVGKPGSRPVPMARELWIERDDFAMDPPKDYQRLAPGRTVRLRHGYCVTYEDVVEQDGEVVEVRVRHLPETLGTNPAGIKVAGVIHWVSAAHAIDAEVRLYDRLFAVARPEDAEGDFIQNLNPDSLRVVRGAKLEASLGGAAPGSRWQLERVGYFVFDAVDSRPDAPVLNRIVTLRDAREARPGAEAREPAAKSARAKTRPARRSPAEYRAEARARDATLAAAFDRLQAVHGLAEADADVLTGDPAVAAMVEGAIAAGGAPAAVARWLINDPSFGKVAYAMTPAQLAVFVGLPLAGPAAKEVFARLRADGGDPRQIAAERGLDQASDDGAIDALVVEVIASNPDKVAQYRGGKVGLLGFFVGQVVKASAGKASPQRVQELLKQHL